MWEWIWWLAQMMKLHQDIMTTPNQPTGQTLPSSKDYISVGIFALSSTSTVYTFPSDWTSEKLSKLWIAFWDSRQSSNVVLFLKAWYWAIYSKILWNSPLFPFISSICLSWVRITESDFLFSLGFPISKIPDFMVFRFRFLCRINNDFLQNSDNFLRGLDCCIILCSL